MSNTISFSDLKGTDSQYRWNNTGVSCSLCVVIALFACIVGSLPHTYTQREKARERERGGYYITMHFHSPVKELLGI